MGKVFTQASVSLDGFIAGPGHSGFEKLFAWCRAGDVETPSEDPDRLIYRTNAATAAYLRELMETTGALIVGRTLYDMTNGWDGKHPGGLPVFVVTHRAPEEPVESETPFIFVTDGIESAIKQAQALAGDKRIGIGPGSTVGQAINAGLVDEIRVDLVPLILGSGTPMLSGITEQLDLQNPEVIVGQGVTHLIYSL
ncbi:dihydrofolate reductase family protein [Kribbella sp. NPDC056951]|uniref:dihydrofolate reductase family protein n=1 Tax=Kribbella sp. NPDC056951 TaxID=3345978 RepID=UPI00363CEF77